MIKKYNKKQAMLYAKILPTAKISKQVNPFTTEVLESDYMTAMARPYGLGAKQVNFEVLFGTITFDAQNAPIEFHRNSNTNVTLTDTELANWGTDDSFVLTTIGVKIGTVASDFVTINTENQLF